MVIHNTKKWDEWIKDTADQLSTLLDIEIQKYEEDEEDEEDEIKLFGI
ncbi:MAG: hypothetical protein ACXAC8_05415 [Candidatus Hodarchaeales archaeon]